MAGKVSRPNSSKRIFVTGGSGLVGSHLINRLLLNGHQVTALYRKEIPSIKGAELVNWVMGDILDVIFLDESFISIDEVYHCAAVVSFNPKDKENMLQVNVEGTTNVVNAALNAGVKKLCYVSSVAALGKQEGNIPLNENNVYTKQTHNSYYGQSKYYAEAEVWRAIGEGLNCVIVSPTIVLGAGDWTHGSTQIFKSSYESFPWYSEGTNGFVDVEDLTDVMIRLNDSDVSGEKFIVMNENNSYQEIFRPSQISFQKSRLLKK